MTNKLKWQIKLDKDAFKDIIIILILFQMILYKLINMDTATRFQIQDKTDCISHCVNSLGKGMNWNILPPAMGK